MHVFQDRCIKDIHRGLRVFMLVLDLSDKQTKGI